MASSSSYPEASLLLQNLPAFVPSASSSSSSVQLQTPQDGLVAVFHSALIQVGFVLVGLSEQDSLSSQDASSPILPAGWNSKGPDSYTLRYQSVGHEQDTSSTSAPSSLLLRLSKLGPRLSIDGLALHSDQSAHWQMNVNDYTSADAFPWPKASDSSSSSKDEGEEEDGFVSIPDPKQQSTETPPSTISETAFVSTTKLVELLVGFKNNILVKLFPQQFAADDDSGPSGPPAPRPPQADDPDSDLRMPGRLPAVPRQDGVPFSQPGRNPLSIGDRDLDPLGGARPPGAGNGNPFAPPPLFGGQPGGNNSGGMYLGPDDPIFRDRFRQPQGGIGGGNGPQGPWGGDGFLPPGGAPPGARFDPVGPFGAGPGFPGGRGPGGGPQPRGGGRSGDPDWDELRPPGRSSDYDNMFM